MKDDKCQNCKWWGGERAHQDDMPLGRCRGTLPFAGRVQVLTYHDSARPSVSGPMVQRGEWPWTAFDDWCALFYPRVSLPGMPYPRQPSDASES